MLVCAHCKEQLRLGEIRHRPGPGANDRSTLRSMTRRREGPAADIDGVDGTLLQAVDAVGDRWTTLVLEALYLGLNRFDDINSALKIPTNILADRMRRLLAAGILEQRIYREHRPRYEYVPTDKGKDLLAYILTLHEWGSRWTSPPRGPMLVLTHESCNRRLRSRLACRACDGVVRPREVRSQ
jgi:DNA-binding HxlR family transcriptional regulator